MRAAAICTAALLLAGCTTLPNLQSFFGPTPQQRCAGLHKDWRAVITYQSDGSGSWRIDCVKPPPKKPTAYIIAPVDDGNTGSDDPEVECADNSIFDC